MTKASPYTLEFLRASPEAAWLWDGLRARIVWANKPAIMRFGGKSMFDLIDRPFDFGEPGIERIADLARNLSRGETVEALLHFPSTGQNAPIHALCMIHALIDGRAGVLVVEKSAIVDAPVDTPPDVFHAAFDLMPMAAALLDGEGTISRLNGQAQRMIPAERGTNLATLIGHEDVANELLARLQNAATASGVQTLETNFGRRDLRLTLQRLGGQSATACLLLIDDVTERRAMEKCMDELIETSPTPHPVATAAEDAQVFEKLGHQLNSALTLPAQDKILADVAKFEPAAITHTPEKRMAPAIPVPLRDTLNRVSDALIIAQNEKIVFANQKCLALLGFDSIDDLINHDQTWNVFADLSQSVPHVEVGNGVNASVATSQVAWHGGPARQFLLKTAAAPNEVKHAAPLAASEAVLDSPVMPSTKPGSGAVALAPEVVAEEVVTQPDEPFSNVVKLQSAMQNLRGQPAAEEDLRAILDTASDGIITLDRQGRIQTFSAGAEAIFGYRIAEVADQQLADLLTVESRKTLKDYLASLEGTGLERAMNDGREVTAVVKQGGSVTLFLTIGTMQSRKTSAAFCAVLRDITQWKRTEKELRDAVEHAQAASRQKSEFLAHISHELRTPLNSILGFSEMMRMERFGTIENEKYRGYVNDIHTSGSHLLSLINDLLDLSKVESGKLDLNFTSVNVSDVVDHAVRLLQDPATIARVVVRKAIPSHLPNVVADLRSLRQIMLNLLSNAIKFTDPGGQVIISAQILEDGGLALRVKDTGIGMNATQINDALEPFKRVPSEGRITTGTGLGLPLTKALVEANRAGFAIASEPRKGTAIEIIFPTTRVLAE